MHRYIVIAIMLTAVLLPSTPSLAITPKEKMATCKFGADAQNLKGAGRNVFMKKCMANKDDPRGPAIQGGAPGAVQAAPGPIQSAPPVQSAPRAVQSAPPPVQSAPPPYQAAPRPNSGAPVQR